MSESCEMYPEIGGKPSKLFTDLLDKTRNRPLTKYVYAAYLQEGVAASITKQGYATNEQGQHNAKAVMQYFDVVKMQNEIGRINYIIQSNGSQDRLGNYIDFKDPEEALKIADNSNRQYAGTVSYVVQHGDTFNVVTEPKDSRSQIKSFEVRANLRAWDEITQTFSEYGIDLRGPNFSKSDIANANDTKGFLSWLTRLKNIKEELFSPNDLKTLLSMDEESPQVERLKKMFGDMDEVSEQVWKALNEEEGFTQSQLDLIHAALDKCKQIKGLDVEGLKEHIEETIWDTASEGKEVDIEETLQSLNEEFGLDPAEIHRIGGTEITRLQDAAVDAITVLKRRLRNIMNKEGLTTEAKRLTAIVNDMAQSIRNKRYYFSTIAFLRDAAGQIPHMDSLIREATQISGTDMERNMAVAGTIKEVGDIVDAYSNILKALSNIDQLIIDDNLSPEDKSSIRNQAKKILALFNKYKDRVNGLKKPVMIDIATNYLGTATSNGVPIANIVAMAQSDSSILDKFVYSMGRVSHPLIATMGSIIRDAQGERTQKMVDISLRIRRATNKLAKSGSNTSFMYEDNNRYIISDIDWGKYKKAKERMKKLLRKRGVRGLDFIEAMNAWEEANTTERIVDLKSGRTELIPNENYRKEFPDLTEAQEEYYEEMMQLKGEIGTLLPKYAQKQYLPPQLRRSFIDAIANSKGNPKAIAKAILNKMKDVWTIRKDDPLNSRNGVIIDNEEYGISSGNFDDTTYKQIPIFYINRIEDPGELLKDFSGALQALAGTAINYECIDKIKSTVEFMGDFIANQNIDSESVKGKKLVDRIASGIVRQLIKRSKGSNTAAIVQGFIDKHIYGVKQNKVTGLTKVANDLLKYTSISSLATNYLGANANYLMGEIQMMIEAGAGEFYNPKNYIWAHAKIFGDNVSYGRIMDFMTNDTSSKAVLLSQRFDPLNETYQTLSHTRYGSPLRKLLSKDFTFIGYSSGEYLIHLVNMYAILHHTKVRINGEKATLYDAFYKSDKIEGNSQLLLKDDATYKDENGNWVAVDDAFLDKIRDRIRYCNQTCHGSMNEEDKGLIHQSMMGKFVMCLRQWTVEHYSRRFRKRHWDASLKSYREGYYTTTIKFMKELTTDMIKFRFNAARHWNELTTDQKYNCKRAIAEQVILACLFGLSFALGEPEDHKKEWWTRMWIYQVKRMIMETRGSSWGIPWEANKMINSPVAATKTVNAFLYPILGIGDLQDTVKTGRYKGWNKYGRNLLKYDVPFYNQIDNLIHMGEEDFIFGVFHTNIN